MAKRKQPKRDLRKRGITEGTSSIGTGPVSFDVTVARAHGWTDASIDKAYDQIAAIVNRGWGHAQRRFPERYRRNKHNDDIIFVGAIDEDRPALKLDGVTWLKSLKSRR